MDETLEIVDWIEYRVIIVDRVSRTVLALEATAGCSLPCISIPGRTRPAQQLCRAIDANLGLRVLILDFVVADNGNACIVLAELLAGEISNRGFAALTFEQLSSCDLSEREIAIVAEMLHGPAPSALSRLGWIDEAVAWVEAVTGLTLSSRSEVAQWNAGGGFALLRFRMENGRSYWLKATAPPNDHEFAVTVCLADLSPDSLPPLVAAKKEWNVWLMEEAGTPFADRSTEDLLTDAAKTFACLQLQTADCLDLLLAAGAFDLRLPVLRKHIDPIAEFLVIAMARQSSVKVAPLSRGRIHELAAILHQACDRMESLGIPDTLIHNDLSEDNILCNGIRCVFTDWSEAALSNPFLSCERLYRLNPDCREQVRAIYRATWSNRLSADVMEDAFALAPLLAIYAYLHGRGDWIDDKKHDPKFESYARSLARHMDREAKGPRLLEKLCR